MTFSLCQASIIHGLIEAYGLLQHMTVKPPLPTGKEELTAFHSQDFIDCLEKLNHEEDSEKDEELQMQFGLGKMRSDKAKKKKKFVCPNKEMKIRVGRSITFFSLFF